MRVLTDIDHYLLSKIALQFRRFIGFMRTGVPEILQKLEGFIFFNKNLKNAATRFVVPQPFQPFVDIINEYSNYTLPGNLLITKDDVLKQDSEMLETFSKENLDFSKMKFDYLLLAGYLAAVDLFIIVPNFKYETLTLDECLNIAVRNTNAGYPTFKKKNDVIATDDALDFATKFLKSPKIHEILIQPCAIFHRFQYKISSNVKEVVKKIRPIWGVPLRVLLLEISVFGNIVKTVAEQNRLSENPSSSIGLRRPEVSSKIINHIRTFTNSNVLSLDVKQFDSNVPTFLWALFFAIVSLSVAIPHRSLDLLKSLMCFGCYTPYVWNDNKLKFQRKGVPSGSFITNLIDTWVSLTVVKYAFLERTKGKDDGTGKCFALGDDCLVVLDGISESYLIDVYKRFGLPIQPEKSAVTSTQAPFVFLGYIWDTQNRPTQTIEWYIAHFTLPSRFEPNLDYLGTNPVAKYQTMRCLNIVAGLFGGLEVFERLIGNYDPIYQSWLAKLNENPVEGDPMIYYFGENREKIGSIAFPLSKLLFGNWYEFG